MRIATVCSCGKRFQAKESLAGKRVKCPVCGQSFEIPRPQVDPLGVSSSDPLGLGDEYALAPPVGIIPNERRENLSKKGAAQDVLKRAQADLRERQKSSTGFSIDDATSLWRSWPPGVKGAVGIVVGIIAFLSLVGLFVQPLGALVLGLLVLIACLAGFVGFVCLVIHAFSEDDAASGAIMLGSIFVSFLDFDARPRLIGRCSCPPQVSTHRWEALHQSWPSL
jgi:hypothetical protein